ncbi:MAG: thioredoxin domain-containing protein [Myxococcota bacterium]
MIRKSAIWAAMLVGCAANESKAPPSSESTTDTKAAVSSDHRLPTDQVVARWNGGQITYGELYERLESQLKRAQTEYLSEVNKLEQQGLESAVLEAIVEEEAKKANTTPEEYLKSLQSEDVEVTEAEIQAFYDQRVRGRQPMEAVRERIVQFLEAQKKQEGIREGLEALKKERGVNIELPAPEVPKAEFNLAGRPFKGPEDAKVTLVEFSDFQCPYCARATAPVEQILAAYPEDVKVYFLHFPLSFHKQAMPAAIAAECAHQQGSFWKMHDLMFENQSKLEEKQYAAWAQELGLDAEQFESCVADPKTQAQVRADMAMGEAAGVGGTPSFYINGVQYSQGVPNEDAIKEVLGGV